MHVFLRRKLLDMRPWMLAFFFLVSALNIQSKAASKGSGGNSDGNVCRNPDCYKMGINISMYINRSAKPCDDFYDYVCKNWKASNPVPDYMPSYGHLWLIRDELTKQLRDILEGLNITKNGQRLQDKIGLAYKSCMKNVTGTSKSELLNLLTEFGICGWPLKQGETALNWTIIYRKMRIGADLNILFALDADTYRFNSTVRAISIKPPSFVPSEYQIYSQKRMNDSAVVAYKNFIQETVRLFSTSTDNQTLEAIANDIFEFEVNLSKCSLDPAFDNVPDVECDIYTGENCNNTYDYEDYSGTMDGVEDLEARASNLETTIKTENGNTVKETTGTKLKDIDTTLGSEGWRTLFTDVFKDFSVSLNGDEEVNVWKSHFFKKVMELTQNTSGTTLSNYFGWRFLYKFGPIASEAMRKLNFEFNKVWRGLEGEEPHWRRCVNALNDPIEPLIGYGLGNLYIKQYFNSTQRDDIEHLAKKIKNAFEGIIQNTTWMDNVTKENARKKLENLVFKIGYPLDITNETLLETMYESVGNITEDDLFLNTVLKFSRNNAVKKLKKIHTPYNRTDEWPLQPMSVNGYHSLGENSAVFPAVLLQYPFYAHGLTSAVKMGTMGFILGHEVSHAFFGPGKDYHLNGDEKEWWSNTTTQHFKKPETCVQYLYGNETEKTTNISVDGLRTLNENVADIWGLEAAFLAHKKLLAEKPRDPQSLPCLTDFNADKLFFIALAYSFCQNDQLAELEDFMRRDVHSPSKIRVNTLFRNSKSFAETFTCGNLNSTCSI